MELIQLERKKNHTNGVGYYPCIPDFKHGNHKNQQQILWNKTQ